MIACRCSRQHRTHRTLVKCLWPRAAWAAGDGRYALLAHCDVLTITLHKTMQSAGDSKDFIDRTGCGHACHRAHEILDLSRAS